MELNCPNCTTHFTVPDDAIGPKGRKLKCAMCGHTWKQMPAGFVPEAVDIAPPPRRAAPPPPAPEPIPEQISFEDALADARNTFAAEREAESSAVPMEMAPGGRQRPDPLDGYGDDDIPMDSAPAAAQNRRDDDEDPLAGLDFGDLGGLDDVDDGFDSVSKASSRRDDISASDLDDLLAAEPEPIPELFGRTSDMDDDDDFGEEPRRGGPLTTVLVVLVILMAGLGAGAWFGRSAVVEAFPQAEKAYAMLGIRIDEPDTGLLFKDVTSERLAQNGTDTLVVRGFIANISAAPRRLPQLTLVLFDKTDAPIQRAIVDPPQPNLEPGNTTGFRIQLENPSLLAQRFEMNWVKPSPADEK